jgi:hypothetical protein
MMQSEIVVEGGGPADLGVVAGIGESNCTAIGVQSVSGEGVAMGGRGVGEKSHGTGMDNSTVKEGGAEQPQTNVGAAEDEAVDEELKNSLKLQVLEITSKVEEVMWCFLSHLLLCG